MQNEVKIGDVVPWSQVPSGAMVRCSMGDHALRRGEAGCWVSLCDHWYNYRMWWPWDSEPGKHTRPPFTIIALNLTGQEPAAELQRLAEIFDVCEAFVEFFRAEEPADVHRLKLVMMALCDGAAEVLHAAGWRRGMSLAQAHKILSEATCENERGEAGQ